MSSLTWWLYILFVKTLFVILLVLPLCSGLGFVLTLCSGLGLGVVQPLGSGLVQPLGSGFVQPLGWG